MISKVARKLKLGDASAQTDDLAYWMSRPPEERISAVELLRRERYGSSARLQRHARVVKQTRR
jgi:hypothetical protein